MVTFRARIPKVFANSFTTAELAFPSTAGACTATTKRGGFPTSPPTLLRDELGRTLISINKNVWLRSCLNKHHK